MLLRHSLAYALGRGLPGLVNFLAIAVYTRLLYPEVYGHYALVIAAAGFAQAVLLQWLQLALFRFLPGEAEPAMLLAGVRAAFLALLALSGLVALPLLLLAPLPPALVLAGLALLGGQAWLELNLELARIRLLTLRYGVMSAIRAVGALVLGAFLILRGQGALGPLLGIAAASLAASLPMLPAWRGLAWRGALRARLAPLAPLARYGLPLAATSILSFVVAASDRFLIAHLVGSEATGAYAAAYDLGWFLITMLMVIVNLAGYPLVLRALESGGPEAARAQLGRNLLLLLAIALPAATGLALLAPGIAAVVLGPGFRATGAWMLPFVALAALLAGLQGYHLDLAFQIGRRTHFQLWIMLAAGVLNLGLNLLLIPPMGLAGAMLATVFAYALAALLSLLLGRRVFALPLVPAEAGKPVLATLVMALALWWLPGATTPLPLALEIGAGALVYALALLAQDIAGSRRRLLALLRGPSSAKVPDAGA